MCLNICMLRPLGLSGTSQSITSYSWVSVLSMTARIMGDPLSDESTQEQDLRSDLGTNMTNTTGLQTSLDTFRCYKFSGNHGLDKNKIAIGTDFRSVVVTPKADSPWRSLGSQTFTPKTRPRWSRKRCRHLQALHSDKRSSFWCQRSF